MSDIRNLSGISVDTGVGAPVSEVPDAGEVLEKDHLAFHDALAKGGEPRESQSPETRQAVKRSLDRFRVSSETEGASGSSESEVAGASRGRSTRRTADRPAGAVAGDGPVPARGTRGAADADGEDLVSAQSRSPRNRPTSPRAGDGGGRGAPASSLPSTKQSRATADREPAGAGAEGALAPEQERAESAVEAAQSRSPRNHPTSPPAVDGGNRGAPGSSLPSTKQSRATVDRKPAGAGAEGALAPGQERAESAVEAARTTPATGTQATPPREPRGPSVSRTQGIVSGTGEDDAHDPDIAAIDMTGVAASAGATESGRTNAPEGVQAPASRAAELAEQVADRILVSMPDSGAPGEVRISLRQSILDGSDVRIFHDGGELKVVFVAETESAQRLLINIREQVQQTLGERLQDQRVHVEVEAPARGGASREDGRGRSRQQYVGQDDSSGAS